MAFKIPGESPAEERFRKRMERAKQAQEEREKKVQASVSFQIAHREHEEEMRKWQERMSFDMYLLADRILERVEEQIRKHAPKTPEEPWSEEFCNAVRMLPEARQFAKDCMIDCTKQGSH